MNKQQLIAVPFRCQKLRLCSVRPIYFNFRQLNCPVKPDIIGARLIFVFLAIRIVALFCGLAQASRNVISHKYRKRMVMGVVPCIV
jgi:hypothetical protein